MSALEGDWAEAALRVMKERGAFTFFSGPNAGRVLQRSKNTQKLQLLRRAYNASLGSKVRSDPQVLKNVWADFMSRVNMMGGCGGVTEEQLNMMCRGTLEPSSPVQGLVNSMVTQLGGLQDVCAADGACRACFLGKAGSVEAPHAPRPAKLKCAGCKDEWHKSCAGLRADHNPADGFRCSRRDTKCLTSEEAEHVDRLWSAAALGSTGANLFTVLLMRMLPLSPLALEINGALQRASLFPKLFAVTVCRQGPTSEQLKVGAAVLTAREAVALMGTHEGLCVPLVFMEVSKTHPDRPDSSAAPALPRSFHSRGRGQAAVTYLQKTNLEATPEWADTVREAFRNVVLPVVYGSLLRLGYCTDTHAKAPSSTGPHVTAYCLPWPYDLAAVAAEQNDERLFRLYFRTLTKAVAKNELDRFVTVGPTRLLLSPARLKYAADSLVYDPDYCLGQAESVRGLAEGMKGQLLLSTASKYACAMCCGDVGSVQGVFICLECLRCSEGCLEGWYERKNDSWVYVLPAKPSKGPVQHIEASEVPVKEPVKDMVYNRGCTLLCRDCFNYAKESALAALAVRAVLAAPAAQKHAEARPQLCTLHPSCCAVSVPSGGQLYAQLRALKEEEMRVRRAINSDTIMSSHDAFALPGPMMGGLVHMHSPGGSAFSGGAPSPVTHTASRVERTDSASQEGEPGPGDSKRARSSPAPEDIPWALVERQAVQQTLAGLSEAMARNRWSCSSPLEGAMAMLSVALFETGATSADAGGLSVLCSREEDEDCEDED